MRGRLLSTRYRLTEPIGAGGMGEVWRARDEALGRDVAVKVFQPPREGGTAFGEAGTGGYDSRSELLARFRQEARAAAALDSPNIVAVHDFDTDQELPYLVMALVAGQSLEQLLRAEGRLPLDRSLRWAEQICRALAAAHGAGVIHRDIKPGNVMVTDDDTVKVLDFGIAKFLDTDDAADKLTRTGQMPFGTVLYMAPEQFTQQASDGRLDLYALGCVLYELLVGRPPYTGPAAGIMYNHLHSTPLRPSAARPELTPAVDRLVLDLMARDPADRPADAEAAGERVRELRATLSRVTPTRPPDTEPPDTEPPNAEPPNAEAGRASGGPADDVARGGRSPASGTRPAPESEPRDAAELTPAAEPRDAVPTALPRTPNAQLDRHRRLRAGRKSWLKAAAVVAVPIALVAALNHNPFGGGSGAGPDLVITASGTDADRLSEVIRASGDPGPRGLRVERTPEEGYEDWDELVEGHPEVIAHFGEGPSSPGAPVVTVHAHESELIDDHAHSTVANRAVVARRLLAHLRERYDLGSLLHLGDTGGSGLLSRALFLQARAADTDVRFLAAGGDRDEEPDRAEVRRVIKSHAPEVAVLPNSDGDDPPPYTAAKLREDGFRGVILLEYPVDEYELAKTGVGTGAQEAEGVLRVRQFADPQADHNCELGRELCEVATGFTDPNTSSLEAFDAMLAVARALENVNSQMSVERAREAFEDGLITKEQGLLGPLGIAATEEQAIEHTTESEYGRLRPFWLDRSTDGRWQEQLKL